MIIVLYVLCTYYLYSVSRPDKYGRPTVDPSKDPEARVELSTLSESQLLLEQVITKVFNHNAIPLDVSDAIRGASCGE